MTIKEILKNQEVNSQEIEIFLSDLLNKDRSFLHAFPEKQLTDAQVTKFNDFIQRRKNHEPLAYILGYQDFYALRFKVTRDVLIPRPETEELVSQALVYMKSLTSIEPVIADVGTGSGAIAISLAKNLVEANIYAVDIDEKALSVAKENAWKNAVSNQITFIKSNILAALPEKIDVIVANLPYIPTERFKDLEPELGWEPRLALEGGKDGMKYYNELFKQAKNHLNPKGILLYEIDGEIYRKTF